MLLGLLRNARLVRNFRLDSPVSTIRVAAQEEANQRAEFGSHDRNGLIRSKHDDVKMKYCIPEDDVMVLVCK